MIWYLLMTYNILSSFKRVGKIFFIALNNSEFFGLNVVSNDIAFIFILENFFIPQQALSGKYQFFNLCT